jgi:hypothetical protein
MAVSWFRQLLKLRILVCMACGLQCAAFGANAQAVTLDVPADHPTIQAAIDAAAAGDEVRVAPGTYAETIDFLGKAIELRSSGGSLVTVIDGSGSSGSVIRCVSGEGPDTVLEGFTITGGNAVEGGGMFNFGSSPTVIDCSFSGNYASSRGGGMYNRQGSPTVTGTRFRQNHAVEMGGGMFNTRASPTISDCLFTENTSNKGAGMRNYIDSHPTISRSTFSDNHAGEEGGGLDNRKNSNAVVAECLFVGNTAGSSGGGMHNYVGKAISTGNPTILNSLIVGNAAPTGGGIRNNDVSPTLINTNVIFNHGPGISSRQGSRPLIVNSIVWGNTGGSFSGETAALSEVRSSDIEGGFPGPGNLDVEPGFQSPAGADGDPDTLDDNDYRLTSDSPLLDVGDNGAPGLPASDLAGNPRISGGTVDLGAYELTPTAIAIPALPGSGYALFAALMALIWGFEILKHRRR